MGRGEIVNDELGAGHGRFGEFQDLPHYGSPPGSDGTPIGEGPIICL